MKITILAVGKIKEDYLAKGIEEYKKRLSKFCEVEIIEVAEQSKISQPKLKSEAEGRLLLEKCSGNVVCLDKSGKMFSSEEIAKYIDAVKLSGESKMTFIIGGSNGLSNEVLSRSNLNLSFGNITYPHQLFRVILLEQIYRAFTISAGLPYHK